MTSPYRDQPHVQEEAPRCDRASRELLQRLHAVGRALHRHLGTPSRHEEYHGVRRPRTAAESRRRLVA